MVSTFTHKAATRTGPSPVSPKSNWLITFYMVFSVWWWWCSCLSLCCFFVRFSTLNAVDSFYSFTTSDLSCLMCKRHFGFITYSKQQHLLIFSRWCCSVGLKNNFSTASVLISSWATPLCTTNLTPYQIWLISLVYVWTLTRPPQFWWVAQVVH